MTRRSNSMRWTVLIALVASGAAALVLAFLLAVATNSRDLYERHFSWLLWVNIGMAAVLGLVIVGALVRLVDRMRRGKFGSQLLFKLAAIFAFVGVVPGTLIYGVSYQFVSSSIESWFDIEVEAALEAGLNLGRATIQGQVNELAAQTRSAAERSAAAPEERLNVLALERLREQLSADSVAVLATNGQVLVSAGGTLASALLPERPSPALLRRARDARVVSAVEGLDEEPVAPGTPRAPPRASVRALAWVPSQDYALSQRDRYLQVTRAIPGEMAANALRVQAAYSEYQQRSLASNGLRRMYIGTLTLALILGVFSALLMAAALGHQLARPLLMLAEGVRRVARGDLRPAEVFASRDELGGLTRSFADMTQQLADARGLVQTSLVEVESAKSHLQTILDNLTSGVILFDHRGEIDTANPGAARILRVPMQAWRGHPLVEVPGLETFARDVDQRFGQLGHDRDADPAGKPRDDDSQWQDTFELSHLQGGNLTLLVHGAVLPEGTRLLVLDDITDVVSAQRSVAWAEVARRVAHEIKNPLTPIQLSAERLEHRLLAKLADPVDQQMLGRSVATIVAQVQAMKTLVNEFRDYARLPAAQLQPLDLNALVSEVLGLYASEQETGRLATAFGADLPLLLGDASQLRQVIHNLVQNALDAVGERADGLVQIETRTRRESDGSLRSVRLQVRDNGPGFTESLLKRAFEPYVTTKTRGTGLGLAVVKKITEEHGARLRVSNLGVAAKEPGIPESGVTHTPESAARPSGAQVSISFSRWVEPLPSSDRQAVPGPLLPTN